MENIHAVRYPVIKPFLIVAQEFPRSHIMHTQTHMYTQAYMRVYMHLTSVLHSIELELHVTTTFQTANNTMLACSKYCMQTLNKRLHSNAMKL